MNKEYIKILNNEDIIAHYGVKGMKWKNRKKSLFQTIKNDIKQKAEDSKRNDLTKKKYSIRYLNKLQNIEATSKIRKTNAKTNKEKKEIDKKNDKKINSMVSSEYLKNLGEVTIGQVKSNVKYGKKLTNKTVLNKKGIKKTISNYKNLKKNAAKNIKTNNNINMAFTIFSLLWH